MLNKAASRITAYFVARGILNEELAPWSIYALQRRVLTWVSSFFLFLLGACAADAPSSFLFLLCFFSLRKRAGGYHAARLQNCLFLSALLFLGELCLLYPLLLKCADGFVAGGVLLTSFSIWWTGPTAPPTLHLTPAALEENRRRMGRILLIMSLFLCIFAFVPPLFPLACAGALGLFSVLLSLIVAKIFHQEECKNE